MERKVIPDLKEVMLQRHGRGQEKKYRELTKKGKKQSKAKPFQKGNYKLKKPNRSRKINTLK